jgi:hypothetical protein
MAHTFKLDIELICDIAPVTWTLGRAKPFTWSLDRQMGDRYLGMTITSPAAIAGERCWIREAIPRELRRELFVGKKKLSSASRQQEFDVLIGYANRGERGKALKVDPWALRNEFLRLKETNEALVAFLNKCGDWDESTSFWGYTGYKSERRVRIFNPKSFWDARPKIIEAMKVGILTWRDSAYGSDLQLRRRQEFPHLVHVDVYCFDAMMHTVTFDHLRRVKFRLCARPDCRNPFSVESQHKREYCDNYCAHLESVRRLRKRAKGSTSKRIHSK